MKYLAQISVASLMLGTLWLVTTRPAHAQDVSQKQISAFDQNQSNVRQSLRDLFKQVGTSYSIAPEVQGQVTVSLRNVTFETALQNVLRQVDATYRIEGGVYEIVPHTPRIMDGDPGLEPAAPAPQGFQRGGMQGPGQGLGGQFAGAAPVMQIDGKFLYIMRGPVLYKVDKNDLKVIKMEPLPNPGGPGMGGRRGGGFRQGGAGAPPPPSE